MHRYEREQLLERVERPGATLGTDIPETVTVGDEQVDLRAFVFQAEARERVPAADAERVAAVKRTLRRERSARVERIEAGDVDRETGERLADEAVGLDRALEALEALDDPGPAAAAAASEAADRKRWTRFLRRALGRDDADDAGSTTGAGSGSGR